jgi:hypothetical protein
MSNTYMTSTTCAAIRNRSRIVLLSCKELEFPGGLAKLSHLRRGPSCGHAAAFLRAAAADFGAGLAVCGRMFGAFTAAGIADLGTQGAYRFGKLAASCHEGGGETADVGAVQIELNTAQHHLHLVFLQARRSTMAAGGGTLITGIYTGLELLMRHRCSSLEMNGNPWQHGTRATTG